MQRAPPDLGSDLDSLDSERASPSGSNLISWIKAIAVRSRVLLFDVRRCSDHASLESWEASDLTPVPHTPNRSPCRYFKNLLHVSVGCRPSSMSCVRLSGLLRFSLRDESRTATSIDLIRHASTRTAPHQRSSGVRSAKYVTRRSKSASVSPGLDSLATMLFVKC